MAKFHRQDFERNKKLFNIESMLSMPSNFFGPEGPMDKSGLSRDFRLMRLLTSIHATQSELPPGTLYSATSLAFQLLWRREDARDQHGNVLLTTDVLRDLCEQSGMSREISMAYVEGINSPPVKSMLLNSVGEAVDRGAFGAPTIFCSRHIDEEEAIFFGSDRFEQLSFTYSLPWYGPDPHRSNYLPSKI
eukprot:gene9253-10960_t